MKNNSKTKYLLVGKVNGKYELIKTYENNQECVNAMNSIEIGSSKYSVIRVLAPGEETT